MRKIVIQNCRNEKCELWYIHPNQFCVVFKQLAFVAKCLINRTFSADVTHMQSLVITMDPAWGAATCTWT